MFIVFSDLHAYKNPSKSYIRDDGMSSWLHSQLNVLDQIFSYAKEHGINIVVHNGDLFHEKSRIPQSLYNIVWSYFAEKSNYFEIILNSGNHDLFSLDGGSSLKPFSDICTVISVPTEYKGMQFVPYGFDIPECTSSILFTHADISGLKYGPNDRESESKLSPRELADWKFVFNGHIHKPQEIGNIVNVGSPMVQDFGEAGEGKRFIHYDGSDWKSIPLVGPQFVTFPYLDSSIKERIGDNNTDYFRFDISSSEVGDDIFEKFNVSYRITKTEERVVRLVEDEDEEKLLLDYIHLMDVNLDKEKLIQIGKEML